MKILRRLFSKRPEINAASAKIDDMGYLLNYERHYADTLTGLGESHMGGSRLILGSQVELF